MSAGPREERTRLLVALLEDRFGCDERIAVLAPTLAGRADQGEVTALVLRARSLDDLVSG